MMLSILERIRLSKMLTHIKFSSFACIKDCQPLDFLGEFTRQHLGRSGYFVYMWSHVTYSLIDCNNDIRQKNTIHDTHGLRPRLNTFKWVEDVMWGGRFCVCRTSLFNI